MSYRVIVPDDTAAAWLRAIAEGGRPREKAVSGLFDKFSRPFERYFIHHRVPEGLAEDLVQDTFVDIVRGAHQWRGDAPAVVWLWTVARNRLLGHCRRDRPETQLDEEQWEIVHNSAEFASEDPAAWKTDCLRRQMGQFESDHPERASCLRFIVDHEWGVPELAAFLSRSQAAAKEYLSQCRKKLRDYLKNCEEWAGEY